MWATQRDPRAWGRLLFDARDVPEISKQSGYSGDTFRYLPIGAGRRICSGISLGEMMVMFILASLLHSVDWALPVGVVATLDLNQKFRIVTRKKKTLVAVPTPREALRPDSLSRCYHPV